MLTLNQIPDAMAACPEGFPRPNFEAISKWVCDRIPEAKWPETFASLQRDWLEQLAEPLAGTYSITESDGFILLSSLPPRPANAILAFCEQAERIFAEELPGVAQIASYGPMAILLFEDTDDHFRYAAYWYPDTDTPQYASGGMLITDPWNPHIVTLRQEQLLQTEAILAHELVHAALFELQLPLWLDEGLAQRLERMLMKQPGASLPTLPAEDIERTRIYWTPERIQDFWSGRSFQVPGRSADRSYMLADILLTIIADNSNYLCDFVADAQRADCGQASARQHLGLSLGDVAAHFLGDGDWEPKPIGETPE